MIGVRRPSGAHHRQRRLQRVDWFRVLADLQYLGLTNLDVATRLDIPRRTVGGWKNGQEPRHVDGDALLELWCEVTGKSRAGRPMCELAGFRRYT